MSRITAAHKFGCHLYIALQHSLDWAAYVDLDVASVSTYFRTNDFGIHVWVRKSSYSI